MDADHSERIATEGVPAMKDEAKEGTNGENTGESAPEDEQPRNDGNGISIFLLGLYLFLVSILALYLLIALWPPAVDGVPAKDWPDSTRLVGGYAITLHDELRLFTLVLLGGALGGLIHALQSFVGFVGSRTFIRSWIAWYILRPLIGSSLAAMFYLALRGGLFANGTGPADTSVFGFVAIGALAGLFSEQATRKLKELFDTLFSTPDDRPDKMG